MSPVILDHSASAHPIQTARETSDLQLFEKEVAIQLWSEYLVALPLVSFPCKACANLCNNVAPFFTWKKYFT